MRNIDIILNNKARIKTVSGEVITGYGDSLLYLPISDDSDEEDEFLRFDTESGNTTFLRESDILDYKIL